MNRLLAAGLLLALASPAAADPLDGVAARVIATISDGDFIARSYADGRLAPREAGHRDLLTVLTRRDGQWMRAILPVSNSVTAAPEILALTPDGAFAFVAERLGERREGGDTAASLPPGNRLFAIDLRDPAAPRFADTAEIAAFPEALALSPDGRRVAVVSNTPAGSFVQLVTQESGRFGAVSRFDLAVLGVTGAAPGPRGGVTATNVQWHPSGRILAVNVNTQDRVAFFRIENEALRPWGAPVAVGRDPFVGRFTPDGRHYLTSNWGRDFAATNLDGRIPRAPSTISVIRLDEAGRHAVVATAETDNSAEGLTVSPDGRLVATVNMRTTAFAPDSPRFAREASVTLLRLDPDTGRIEKLADYPFEGVLPEGGRFDVAGEHLLVTVFEGHLGSSAGAGLEVFRVTRGDGPTLESRGRVALPHGVHHVDLAP